MGKFTKQYQRHKGQKYLIFALRDIWSIPMNIKSIIDKVIMIKLC